MSGEGDVFVLTGANGYPGKSESSVVNVRASVSRPTATRFVHVYCLLRSTKAEAVISRAVAASEIANAHCALWMQPNVNL